MILRDVLVMTVQLTDMETVSDKRKAKKLHNGSLNIFIKFPPSRLCCYLRFIRCTISERLVLLGHTFCGRKETDRGKIFRRIEKFLLTQEVL